MGDSLDRRLAEAYKRLAQLKRQALAGSLSGPDMAAALDSLGSALLAMRSAARLQTQRQEQLVRSSQLSQAGLTAMLDSAVDHVGPRAGHTSADTIAVVTAPPPAALHYGASDNGATAEEEACADDRRFRELVEGSQEPLGIVQDMRLVYANPALLKLLGFSRYSQVLSLRLLDAVYSGDRAAVIEALQELDAGAAARSMMELRLLHKSGELLWIEATASVGRYQGAPAVQIALHDITARKRGEEEREWLIGELSRAALEIERLTGLLPLCSMCHKIRDDHGYWQRLEEYFGAHSGVEFTHGLCPQCLQLLYPELEALKPEEA